jgi:hypothetical protein
MKEYLQILGIVFKSSVFVWSSVSILFTTTKNYCY